MRVHVTKGTMLTGYQHTLYEDIDRVCFPYGISNDITLFPRDDRLSIININIETLYAIRFCDDNENPEVIVND